MNDFMTPIISVFVCVIGLLFLLRGYSGLKNKRIEINQRIPHSLKDFILGEGKQYPEQGRSAQFWSILFIIIGILALYAGLSYWLA